MGAVEVEAAGPDLISFVFRLELMRDRGWLSLEEEEEEEKGEERGNVLPTDITTGRRTPLPCNGQEGALRSSTFPRRYMVKSRCV